MLAPAAGERILDVGAGKGSIAARVFEESKGAEVYAVDPDGKRVDAMKRAFPMIKGSVAGAESLPFPDTYFDKVYATMALHHFADPDRAFAEITRVLKQGGSFVILEVKPNSPKGRLFRLLGRLMGEHLRIMSEAQLLTWLKSTEKFEVVLSVALRSNYLIHLTYDTSTNES